MLILKKLCGCLLSESGGEIVIRFRGSFISGQTGDKKKPETENGGCSEIPEIRKSGGNRKWKVEKYYRFPMWFMRVGPCSFWFRASSSDSM